ncbi:hypothetical protein Tco_1266378 [Tanacetum coccineum]
MCCFTKTYQKVKKFRADCQISQARKENKIIALDEEDLAAKDPFQTGGFRGGIDRIRTPRRYLVAGPEVTTADAELNTTSTFVSTASPKDIQILQ